MGRSVKAANDAMALPAGVRGTADPRFRSIAKAFGRIFARGGKGGALSVYLDGSPVVDICAGTSDRAGKILWDKDTGTIPYSTSKGIASTVIHRLADRNLLDYDAPIAEYWPAFGENGKSAITARDALTHRAGLSGLSGIAGSLDDILDHRRMEERLAAAKPDRYLGAPAYHALTYGWLVAGIARSITGKGMAELFRTEVADPLGVDGIHLGRPPASAPTKAAELVGSVDVFGRRVAQLLTPVAARVPGPLYGTVRTMFVPRVEDLFRGDDPPILNAEMPAANAVATASGLATLYSAIACGGETSTGRLLSADRIRVMSKVQTRKLDRTLYLPMSWRLGYHSFPIAGASHVLGHLGAAGSGAWADPGTGLAMGFVHNRLPDPRTLLFDQTILAWLSPMIVRAAKAAKAGGAVVIPVAANRTAS